MGERIEAFLGQVGEAGSGRVARTRVENASRSEGQVVLTLSFRSRRAAALVELEAELGSLVKSDQLTVLYNSPTVI